MISVPFGVINVSNICLFCVQEQDALVWFQGKLYKLQLIAVFFIPFRVIPSRLKLIVHSKRLFIPDLVFMHCFCFYITKHLVVFFNILCVILMFGSV